MAGSITISTLNNDTGVLATQNGMTGIAKAWCNFSSVDGIIVINSSFNISSVIYLAQGRYTINFTTGMPNANYAAVFGAQDLTTGAEFLSGTASGTKTTTAFQITSWNYNGVVINTPGAYVAIFSS